MNRLAIDRTRCDGHGLCAALLPGGIDLDEWGFPLFAPDARRDGAAGPRADTELRRAVAACPSLALRLEPAPEPSRPHLTETHRTTCAP